MLRCAIPLRNYTAAQKRTAFSPDPLLAACYSIRPNIVFGLMLQRFDLASACPENRFPLFGPMPFGPASACSENRFPLFGPMP
jgi:hypothetical protein